MQLLRVDGVPVVSLGHAAALLEAAPGPFVKLELEWDKVRRQRGAWEGGGCCCCCCCCCYRQQQQPWASSMGGGFRGGGARGGACCCLLDA